MSPSSEFLGSEAPYWGVGPLARDALDPSVAVEVIDGHRPDVLVLVAGATPAIVPFDEQSWEEFSVNWEVDVRMRSRRRFRCQTTPLHDQRVVGWCDRHPAPLCLAGVACIARLVLRDVAHSFGPRRLGVKST